MPNSTHVDGLAQAKELPEAVQLTEGGLKITPLDNAVAG